MSEHPTRFKQLRTKLEDISISDEFLFGVIFAVLTIQMFGIIFLLMTNLITLSLVAEHTSFAATELEPLTPWIDGVTNVFVVTFIFLIVMTGRAVGKPIGRYLGPRVKPYVEELR